MKQLLLFLLLGISSQSSVIASALPVDHILRHAVNAHGAGRIARDHHLSMGRWSKSDVFEWVQGLREGCQLCFPIHGVNEERLRGSIERRIQIEIAELKLQKPSKELTWSEALSKFLKGQTKPKGWTEEAAKHDFFTHYAATSQDRIDALGIQIESLRTKSQSGKTAESFEALAKAIHEQQQARQEKAYAQKWLSQHESGRTEANVDSAFESVTRDSQVKQNLRAQMHRWKFLLTELQERDSTHAKRRTARKKKGKSGKKGKKKKKSQSASSVSQTMLPQEAQSLVAYFKGREVGEVTIHEFVGALDVWVFGSFKSDLPNFRKNFGQWEQSSRTVDEYLSNLGHGLESLGEDELERIRIEVVARLDDSLTQLEAQAAAPMVKNKKKKKSKKSGKKPRGKETPKDNESDSAVGGSDVSDTDESAVRSHSVSAFSTQNPFVLQADSPPAQSKPKPKQPSTKVKAPATPVKEASATSATGATDRRPIRQRRKRGAKLSASSGKRMTSGSQPPYVYKPEEFPPLEKDSSRGPTLKQQIEQQKQARAGKEPKHTKSQEIEVDGAPVSNELAPPTVSVSAPPDIAAPGSSLPVERSPSAASAPPGVSAADSITGSRRSQQHPTHTPSLLYTSQELQMHFPWMSMPGQNWYMSAEDYARTYYRVELGPSHKAWLDGIFTDIYQPHLTFTYGRDGIMRRYNHGIENIMINVWESGGFHPGSGARHL